MIVGQLILAKLSGVKINNSDQATTNVTLPLNFHLKIYYTYFTKATLNLKRTGRDNRVRNGNDNRKKKRREKKEWKYKQGKH